jgi:ssRNA-specific RNase YbeY (16S rRNA maturation enzyme)
MKLILEINNSDSSCNFDEKKLKLTVEKTISRTKGADFFKKDVLVSVGFVSEKEIKKINKQYREKNYPTDILSFANFEFTKDLEDSREEDIFL